MSFAPIPWDARAVLLLRRLLQFALVGAVLWAFKAGQPLANFPRVASDHLPVLVAFAQKHPAVAIPVGIFVFVWLVILSTPRRR